MNKEPLFEIEEEISRSCVTYHFQARFTIDHEFLRMVRRVGGIESVWQSRGSGHFGVEFNTYYDCEIVMFRLKAAIVNYVKENRPDRD